MLRTPTTAPPQAEGRTVGSYFDTPPQWPGPAWRHGNRTASWPVLDASAGPAHCGWETFTFFTMNWPLGNGAPDAAVRQYIRDPFERMGGASLRGTWAHNPDLPGDVTDTGYHYGLLTLYLGSDADRYVYIVAPDDSERWPRNDPPAACV